jgi:catechol 2,3-dioxygenase-like lactoylglutathione lyase family enzyme
VGPMSHRSRKIGVRPLKVTGENKMADDRNWLIDHTGVGVSDIHRSARFYEAALRPLGIKIVMRIRRDFGPAEAASVDLGGVAFGVDYPAFWIDVFHPYGVKQHTAFRAQSHQQIVAFHQAALLAGGTDNGQPGLRLAGYPPGYYAAFVLDPDGNNIEVVFREE